MHVFVQSSSTCEFIGLVHVLCAQPVFTHTHVCGPRVLVACSQLFSVVGEGAWGPECTGTAHGFTPTHVCGRYTGRLPCSLGSGPGLGRPLALRVSDHRPGLSTAGSCHPAGLAPADHSLPEVSPGRPPRRSCHHFQESITPWQPQGPFVPLVGPVPIPGTCQRWGWVGAPGLRVLGRRARTHPDPQSHLLPGTGPLYVPSPRGGAQL